MEQQYIAGLDDLALHDNRAAQVQVKAGTIPVDFRGKINIAG